MFSGLLIGFGVVELLSLGYCVCVYYGAGLDKSILYMAIKIWRAVNLIFILFNNFSTKQNYSLLYVYLFSFFFGFIC